jgi:succinate-acetate transporter protein
MSWGWLAIAVVVWLLSAACIIGTLWELFAGKGDLRKGDFWGGVAFHGVTALVALWLLLKALPKT